MKKSIFRKKGNVKAILFLLGIVLIVSGLVYSQKLVLVLKQQAKDYVHFRIRVFESNINNPDLDTDINFLFNEVIRGADYPIIYTDIQNQPQSWSNLDPSLNDKVFSELNQSDSLQLFQILDQMKNENDPIPIKYQDSLVLGYYYYGFSPVIYKLRLFPFIAIGAATIFILIGYFGFSYIKKSEQQLIWVGMAKETAHQLGTPLSSIAGWLELIKLDPALLDSAVTEANKDLARLNKIANRFSKIGSVPELKEQDPHLIISNVVQYFQRRLPNMQKTIQLNYSKETNIPSVLLNEELFEWVLENLIKNSIDAIEHERGKIDIKLRFNPDKRLVFIDLYDNGKGVSAQHKRDIFKPGFSTKKRGWGLGLSLARRIVEEYHGGKLLLKDSKPEDGTLFRITFSPLSTNV